MRRRVDGMITNVAVQSGSSAVIALFFSRVVQRHFHHAVHRLCLDSLAETMAVNPETAETTVVAALLAACLYAGDCGPAVVQVDCCCWPFSWTVPVAFKTSAAVGLKSIPCRYRIREVRRSRATMSAIRPSPLREALRRISDFSRSTPASSLKSDFAERTRRSSMAVSPSTFDVLRGISTLSKH